ncbi:P2X purinoceptor 7-like [Dermacentor silvarum]|uniref:P2X purinoceptor 7-like n=1 Tax=Dermacentor silvarum TaxID=543639 RepID=UPI0021014A6A|nr:P2X purinoceptor 7-like [Dermacentor silvarum]
MNELVDDPDNDTLARDAGLHFSDLSPDERDMLLRARAAGVVAYYDGGLDTGSSERGSSEDSSNPTSGDEAGHRVDVPSRLSSTDWCECGHCQVLPNFRELECVCCREMGAPVTVAQPQGCITEHPDFNVLCLNIAVLRVVYLELRSWGHTMDDEMHKRYRYTAYRQFVRWLWGRLRKGERFVLPSCAVAKIRATFPTETPTGFK